MKVQNDPLFDIFQKYMSAALMDDEEQHGDQLVSSVVSEYMDFINQQGLIPNRLYHFIEKDVLEDVTQMLKKTTYGYFNLREYQKARGSLLNKLKVRGS